MISTALPLLDASPAGLESWRKRCEHRADRSRHCTLLRRSARAKTSAARPASTTSRSTSTHRAPPGLPKAAKVSHARVMQWSHWFAGMMEVQPTDRMYNCLPMYHSVGGVQAPGAMLVAGGAVVFREKFSASQFWSDIVRWDCTLFQYIGELCRYLLHTPPARERDDAPHSAGLRQWAAPEVWEAFKERFHIPRILEFYAATEGGVSLVQRAGKARGDRPHPCISGASFFAGAGRLRLRKQASRRATNKASAFAAQPINLARRWARLLNDPTNIGSRFEGYTSRRGSRRKSSATSSKSGDAWVRTGDLMRQDEKGYFYFVDRIGDTFRRKGRERCRQRGCRGDLRISWNRARQCIRRRGPGHRRPRGHGTLLWPAANSIWPVPQASGAMRFRLMRGPCFFAFAKRIDLTGTFKYSKTELLATGIRSAG